MKILTIAGWISALVLFAALMLSKWASDRNFDTVNQQLMAAELGLGKAKTSFGEANDYIKFLEAELQQAIKTKDEYATRYGELKAKLEVSGGSKVTGEVTEHAGEKVTSFTKGLLYQATGVDTLRLVEVIHGKFSDHRIAINTSVLPYPNDDLNVSFDFGYQLRLLISGQLVETYAPSGAINYYASIWEVDDQGNKIAKLQLIDFSVIVEKPHTKAFMFVPVLDFGASFYSRLPLTVDARLSSGVSFWGYGLTAGDLDWRFVRLGIELTSYDIAASLAPALWNVGTILPLVSDIWLGPYVGYSLYGFGYGVGLNSRL